MKNPGIPAGADRPVVEVVDVVKTYPGAGVPALRGVSAAFAAGTFCAVMGPSGSGKSTLLHCAAGLDRPDTGRVLLAGQEIGGLREPRLTQARRRRVGFVFQAYNLLDSLSVWHNVLLPQRLAGVRADRAWAREVLRRVGLTGREGDRPGQLSGGQRQRVALARALAGRPEVIFADEPTGALDLSTGREVLGLLREAVDDLGTAVVMVTHDPAAAAWADRVVFLADGRIVAELADPTAGRVAARMMAASRATGGQGEELATAVAVR
ncbi:ABC transporter ATP-binding protein [Micromonosporaceae bacterium B7E4]